jgi:2-keto-4-pentenoate hydratase
MTVIKSDAAINALIAARRTRTPLAALPDGSQPSSLVEAHAMQDAMVAKLGERVAGWKVAINKDGVMRGVIVGSRLLHSPAAIPAADVKLLGIEGEIAFRFDRDLFPRGTDYSAAEIATATTALVGIEIVASRFADYAKTPTLHRTVDLMSNGAFITGTHRPDWRQTDLSTLEAILRVNGTVAVQKTAAHATGDPIVPAVALVNELRRTTGVKSGQIITTGTYTGLHFVKPGDAIEVEFTGFGTASVTVTR